MWSILCRSRTHVLAHDRGAEREAEGRELQPRALSELQWLMDHDRGHRGSTGTFDSHAPPTIESYLWLPHPAQLCSGSDASTCHDVTWREIASVLGLTVRTGARFEEVAEALPCPCPDHRRGLLLRLLLELGHRQGAVPPPDGGPSRGRYLPVRFGALRRGTGGDNPIVVLGSIEPVLADRDSDRRRVVGARLQRGASHTSSRRRHRRIPSHGDGATVLSACSLSCGLAPEWVPACTPTVHWRDGDVRRSAEVLLLSTTAFDTPLSTSERSRLRSAFTVADCGGADDTPSTWAFRVGKAGFEPATSASRIRFTRWLD